MTIRWAFSLFRSGILARAGALLALAAILAGGSAMAQEPAPSVTATLTADPATLYSHQRFRLTLTIRARGANLGQQFNLQGLPSSDLLRMGDFQQLPIQRDTSSGQPVTVQTFRAEVEAVNPGEIQINPTLHFETLTQERTWLGTTTFRSPQRIAVPPLEFRVQPLPEQGRPADFNGAVGRYSISVQASPVQVAVGDLVSLRYTVGGEGALTYLTCPTLASNAEFKVYPPRDVAGSPPGVREFEQIVIPLSTNAVLTPAATLSYFDPIDGKYRVAVGGGQLLRFHARAAAPVFAPYRPEGPATAEEGSERRAAAVVNGATPPWPLLLALAAAALLLLAGWSLISARRRGAGAAAGAWPWIVVAMALTGLILAGILQRTASTQEPEHTCPEDATGRLAPSHAAAATVEFNAGTALTVRERWNHWLRVEDPLGRQGWLPEDRVQAATR